jgi:methylenetetrahydrofolate--tRNA-(uracil-5-)-methyltransferase
MKPVGLPDPRTGRIPYAAAQLRQENVLADAYSLVGFQNHLRFGEQARVIRLIPGLENADIMQYGQIHRNTFINSPRVLRETLQTRKQPGLFFAGQITGVEGYVESVASGWLAGLNAARLARGQEPVAAPPKSATGALARYVSQAEAKTFQPANITFALLEPLPEDLRRKIKRKRERHELQVKLALEEWNQWIADLP